MKKFLLIISLIVLSGCTNVFTKWKIHKAAEICDGYTNINSFNTYFLEGNTYVICMDGTRHVLSIKDK